jgi:chromate transporter
MRELALLFLRLGLTAFGGPAAHIAMMQREVVGRLGWLTEQEFLDSLSLANLIPGPSSTELAIHIGYRRAGWRGLVLAGVCFILPAALLVGALAWAYVRFGQLPRVAGVLWAVKPVVIVLVAEAVWKLSRTALKSSWLMTITLTCVVLFSLQVSPLLVLFTGALLAMAPRLQPSRAGLLLIGGAAPVGAAKLGAWPIFFAFVRIGSVLFGSGYVLLAFLRAELVDRYHWLTSQQLLDAVAIGQVTPGPVFTTATFIGYLLMGPPGAVAATVGIFLPAFVLVAIGALLLPRLRQSQIFASALNGVNAASLALMAVVTVQLGRAALTGWIPIAIALLSAVALFRFRVNSSWVVLGAVLVGLFAGKYSLS